MMKDVQTLYTTAIQSMVHGAEPVHYFLFYSLAMDLICLQVCKPVCLLLNLICKSHLVQTMT